ncbi:MAG TPA: four helix bundle protein [bacterium]|nr:four helix bundle protein [bacterium]
MQYDLEERTAKFGEQIILFCRALQKDEIAKSLINQLIRSATSIGANYMEANHGSSKKDFSNKISLCLKESNETKHWLRMIATAIDEEKEKCRFFGKEAHELTLIFATILKSCKKHD